MKNKSNPATKNEAIKQGRNEKTTKGFESVPYGPSKDINIKPATSKDTQLDENANPDDKANNTKESSGERTHKRKRIYKQKEKNQ